MTPRIAPLVGVVFTAALVVASCTDKSGDGSRNPGIGGMSAGSGGSANAGSGGATGGAGGATGGAGGATGGVGGATGGSGGATGGSGGGTPGFMSIAPCPNESDYVTTPTTIDFGMINGAYAYAPKCLKITIPRGMLGTAGAPGTNVTFSGDFSMHPLEPSAKRGTQTGSPIKETTSGLDGGMTRTFRFEQPGYFAYFCQVHNPSDNGAAMSGVVWAVSQPNLPQPELEPS